MPHLRLFLIRHGESLHNVNKDLTAKFADHEIPLTEFGYEQSLNAGRVIKEYYDSKPELKGKKIAIWHSPYLRASQTKDGFIQGLGQDRVQFIRDDSRVREQDWGIFAKITSTEERRKQYPVESADYHQRCMTGGTYYARPPGGESPVDVTGRTRLFKETLRRDAERRGYEDVVVIAHGVSLRALEMNFMHHPDSAEWFEKSAGTVRNCAITLIEGDTETGQFTATCLHPGEKRLIAMPHDYKARPHGIKTKIILPGR